jgi:RecJ-like exonuclease
MPKKYSDVIDYLGYKISEKEYNDLPNCDVCHGSGYRPITCRACSGRGSVVRYSSCETESGYHVSTHLMGCSSCSGQGSGKMTWSRGSVTNGLHKGNGNNSMSCIKCKGTGKMIKNNDFLALEVKMHEMVLDHNILENEMIEDRQKKKDIYDKDMEFLEKALSDLNNCAKEIDKQHNMLTEAASHSKNNQIAIKEMFRIEVTEFGKIMIDYSKMNNLLQ